MVTKTQDLSKMFQDALSAMPLDASKLQDMFKSQAELGEKMSKVALDAAGKSNEISSKWTKDCLAKMGDLSAVKSDPADYAKSLTEFMSANAEMTAENLAAFAEVAKKVQMETVELMLAAGKDFSEDATAAVKKATADVTAAAKKATAATK